MMRDFSLDRIKKPRRQMPVCSRSFIAAGLAFATMVFLSTALAQSNAGNHKAGGANLSGEWIAAGYSCNGPQDPEHIKIEQKGASVTATKISGDDCIAAGSITWRGQFKDGSFSNMQMQVGFPNQPKSFIPATARLDNSSEQLRLLVAGNNSDTITLTRAATPAETKNGDPPADSGPIVDLCNNTNTELVNNHPKVRTGCLLKGKAYISEVTTYHWNNGQGASPGTIHLLQSGRKLHIFGPFKARGTSGQGGARNVNWVAQVGQTLPAGAYFVIDSDPATWSQNQRSNYRGFAIVRGRLLKSNGANPHSSGVPDLNGEWLADYPGKVLRVTVRQTGDSIEGTLIDGNDYVPAGQLDLRSPGPLGNPLSAEQICAYPGFKNPYWIKVSLRFTDNDHFIEEQSGSSSCGGFPVHWTRAKNAAAADHNQPAKGGPPAGFKPCMVNAGEVGAIGPCSGAAGTTIYLVLNQDLKSPPQKLVFKRVLANGVPAAVIATLTGSGRNYQLAAPTELCAGPFPRQWQVWLVDASGHERGEIGSFGMTGCP